MTLQFLESPFSTELKLSNLKSCNERNSSNPHDPVTLLLYQMNSYLSENFIILIIFFWKLWASIGRSNWKRCKRRYCQGRAQWKTLWEYSISTTHVMRLVTNITAWGNLCHHFGHQFLLWLSWIDPWYLDFDNNACISKFFLTIKESEKTIQCKEAVKFVKPEFCLVLSQHYHSTSPAENIFRVPTTPGQNIFRMVFTFFCSDQDCPINDIIRSYLRPTQMILLFTVRVNT